MKDLLAIGPVSQDTIFDEVHFGGGAGILASNSARLGLNVGLISVFGWDEFSERYLTFLQGEGVTLGLIERGVEKIPTYLVQSKDNEKYHGVWKGNGSKRALEALDINGFNWNLYRYIHLASVPPILTEKILINCSAPVSYEPGPAILDNHDFLSQLMIERSSIIFLNQEEYLEACRIIGVLLEEYYLRSAFPRMLIITNGSNPIRAMSNQFQEISVEIEQVDEEDIQDITGAGDSFKAGLYYGLTKGKGIRESIEFGSIIASASIRQKGGILERDRLQALLKESNKS